MVSVSSRKTTCRGVHPVRRVAEPEVSRASRKAWSRNGLACGSVATASLFHTLASISEMAPAIVAVSVSANCRQKSFEHDLVGPALGGFRGLFRCNGPGGHFHPPGAEETYRRQVDRLIAAGIEVEARQRPMQQMPQHEFLPATHLRVPLGLVIAVGDDAERRRDALAPQRDQQVRIERLERIGTTVVPQCACHCCRERTRAGRILLLLELDL